jgi:peptide/nickel transport system substrate-binding protein
MELATCFARHVWQVLKCIFDLQFFPEPFMHRILTVSLIWFSIVLSFAQTESSMTVIMGPIEGTLDPAFSSNDPDTAFARALFDYFVEPLPDGGVGPNLAREWTISADGLSYTFTMVQTATFHDGTPVTANDVVWTYERLRDTELGSPASNLLTDIDRIEALDDWTVVFHLSQANEEFLLNLASRWSLVIKADTIDFSAGNISNVGSGPFVLESYLPGFDAVFQAYPDYWQESLPKLDTLIFRYEPSSEAQVEALLNGDVHFAFKLPVEFADEVESSPGVNLLREPTNQHPVIRLRTDMGPGVDERVRQAFKLATDRARINDLVLRGLGIVGNNDPIGPAFESFPGQIDTVYDPQEACDLLSVAGYGSPARLEMTLFAPDALNYPDLATVLQEMWTEGCIHVEVIIQPEATYYAQTWLEVDLGITGWGDRSSPQQLLDEAYISTGQFNETRWRNSRLDQLIRQARITPLTDRQAIYAEISEIFADEGPVIIPYFAPILGGISDSVEGLEMPGFPGLTDYRSVTVIGE